MLTKQEQRMLGAVSGDIPISSECFAIQATQLGMTEAELLSGIQACIDRGLIRRFGALLAHGTVGYTANALIAWEIATEKIDLVGETFAAFRFVSHCYARPVYPDWPYNLYTMIHARADETLEQYIRQMLEGRSEEIVSYQILRSLRELKKSSPRYFTEGL